MEVELTRVTVDPVDAIEEAASTCYDSKVTNGKIMNSCYESGHYSVLEFAHFTFRISGVSRALTHQLVRHRTGSFEQRTQRFVKENEVKVVKPKSIENNAVTNDLYDSLMDKIWQVYGELLDAGIPAEDARYVLPNACESEITVEFDLRNLIHLMNERLCSRAQWEIRELANRMKDIICYDYPEFKDYLVPKCEIHKDFPFCTEKHCCGRHKKLSEVYAGESK